MARSRNIKPGFFENAELAELSLYARLLFIGLWTLADREGRLEDRPKQIRFKLMPYDDFDPNATLQQLHDAGFIVRYQVDGECYIQVSNFLKHQTPHCKEKESIIPAPDMHQTCTVLAPPDSLIPDSLIPDSLIPDSLIPTATSTESVRTDSDEQPTQESAVVVKKMPLSVCRDLYRKYFGTIHENQPIVTVLQDICRLYPPERIEEAFMAGPAAGAKSLNWVKKRLENNGETRPVAPIEKIDTSNFDAALEAEGRKAIGA